MATPLPPPPRACEHEGTTWYNTSKMAEKLNITYRLFLQLSHMRRVEARLIRGQGAGLWFAVHQVEALQVWLASHIPVRRGRPKGCKAA